MTRAPESPAAGEGAYHAGGHLSETATAGKGILIALLLVTVVPGTADARFFAHSAPGLAGAKLASTFVWGFLCFLWYRRDSDARYFVRSRRLNVGMVAFAIVAIPYYLLRSRPAGLKARALLRCAGFFGLMVLAYTVGALINGHAV